MCGQVDGWVGQARLHLVGAGGRVAGERALVRIIQEACEGNTHREEKGLRQTRVVAQGRNSAG